MTVKVEPIHNIKVFHNSHIGYQQTASHGLLIDEWLATKVAEEQLPYLHIWRNQQAIVLGQQDLKMPKLKAAVDVLKTDGWDVLVRQSGGAMVVLDPGVVNVSLILPVNPGDLQVDDDFQRLAAILTASIQQSVEIGEIVGSYCPGRYDLSYKGQKFCGIAQRRYASATIVQSFVNVRESRASRALVAQSFYQQASDSQDAKVSVKLECVSSLQAMFGNDDVDSFEQKLLLACERYFTHIELLTFAEHAQPMLQPYAYKIKQL